MPSESSFFENIYGIAKRLVITSLHTLQIHLDEEPPAKPIKSDFVRFLILRILVNPNYSYTHSELSGL